MNLVKNTKQNNNKNNSKAQKFKIAIDTHKPVRILQGLVLYLMLTKNIDFNYLFIIAQGNRHNHQFHSV